MPFSDPHLHLEHVLTSIAFIENFIGNMALVAYQADHKTKFAAERQMQVLTEAAFRLGDQAEVLCPEVDWRGIRGMGNRLRHRYDQISDRVIWNALKIDLPTLKIAVTAALDRFDGQPRTQP